MFKKTGIIAIFLGILLGGCGRAATATSIVQQSTGNKVSEEYFVWEGNTIVGLTEEGAKQKELVIPEKCEEINGPILHDESTAVERVSFESDKDIKLNGSFGGSPNLKYITLPSELLEIGNMEFWLCYSLEEIVIPESVQVIGKYAFKDCTSLKKVVIEEGVTRISANAFYSCSNLSTLELADSITDVEDGAFQNCKALTDLVLPKNLKSVGIYAFSNTGLQNLSVPEEVALESYDVTSFAQPDHDITGSVVPGSWMDQNFESVFDTSGVRE